jgi:peroxiredoxin
VAGCISAFVPQSASAVGAIATPQLTDSARATADWTWVYAKDSLPSVSAANSNARGNWIRRDEDYRRRVRERGMLIFDRYPNDPRRWQWLVRAADDAPFYYRDVEAGARTWDTSQEFIVRVAIDTAAFNGWERRYHTMRAAFMASPETEARHHSLQFGELRRMELKMAMAVGTGQPIDSLFAAYENGVLGYADGRRFVGRRTGGEACSFGLPCDLVHMVVGEPVFQQRCRTRLLRFLQTMERSANTELALYAKNERQLLQLRGRPLEMQFTTVDGRSVDLSQLRGQVVLVDFWGMGCSSCIEAFRHLKMAYEQFHGEGFEIIGVSLDPEAARERNMEVIAKHALPWPQVFVGGEQPMTNQSVRKYQVYTMPEMFLIDQQGKFVTKGYISARELNEYLRQLLIVSHS